MLWKNTTKVPDRDYSRHKDIMNRLKRRMDELELCEPEKKPRVYNAGALSNSKSVGNRDRGKNESIGSNQSHALFDLSMRGKETSKSPNPVYRSLPDDKLDFIGREEVLSRIGESFTLGESKIALVGLGGIGKSRIAIRFGHQFHAKLPESWVFWTQAGSKARLEKGYRGIAGYLDIPGRDAPHINILELVSEYLRHRMEQKYLLIVDDVDDLPNKVEASGPISLDLLKRYIPFGANGYILITSRNAKLARNLTDNSGLIDIKEMTAKEAHSLLVRKIHGREAHENLDELAKALDYIPLAMSQAAAFLNHERHYPMRRFLRKLQSIGNPAWMKQLECLGRPKEDFEIKPPIVSTWHILFEYIWQNHRRAAVLLSQMSLCERQSIPDIIFKEGIEDNSQQGRGNGFEFEEDVQKLKDYSFITEKTETTYTMHSLVQGAIRAWLVEHKKANKQMTFLITKLDKRFPYSDFENEYRRCRDLVPHVQEVFRSRQEVKLFFEDWDYLIYNVAQFMDYSGDYATGLKFVKKMLERCERTNRRDKLTIDGLINQGELLSRVGNWEEAEISLLKAKKLNEENEGDQEKLLWIVYELLMVYVRSDHAPKVLILQKQVKKIRPENRECKIQKIGILAEAYEFQELWGQSEERLREILELTKDSSDEGEERYWYGRKCIALAYSYITQGKYTYARNFLEQELNDRKESGENDDVTRDLTYQLAEVYYFFHEYSNAKDMLLQLQRLYQKCNRQGNLLFRMIEYELVFLDYELEVMQDAELIKQLLKEMKHYSKNCYETEVFRLGAMHKLAKWMKSVGRLKEAISIMTECYDRRKGIYVCELPGTEESLSLLREWKPEYRSSTQNSAKYNASKSTGQSINRLEPKRRRMNVIENQRIKRRKL